MNFLKPTTNNIRKSIRGIDDSYANDWDLLAELIQNAVDAITQSKIKDGKITIEVNCQNSSIIVEDNGIGIKEEVLPDLLKPFATSKENNKDTIGEKGVGLTFAIFQTNLFTIQSGKAIGVIKDARDWKTSDNGEILDLNIDESNENFKGTKVILKRLSSDLPLFKWSKEQLKFVLRTRTAIGNTKALFEEITPLIEVKLIFTNSNGSKETDNKIPYKYFLLTELLGKGKKISMQDFNQFAAAPLRTDLDKRKKLQGKVFEYFDIEKKFYALFVPKRDWNQFTLQAKITTEENLNNDEWLLHNSYTTFQSGITVSVKGMPTGIEIPPNVTGSGYFPNLFIIFEDSDIKFDIGRKSLKGRSSGRFKKQASSILSEYRKYVPKYASAISDEELFEEQFNRSEIFHEIDKMIPLKYKDIKLQKSPKDQEASVAALFYECIGNNKIKDILPLSSGYRKRYDLYALYKNNRHTIIEFKKKASDILKDFDNNQKLFDEIDCLVCWDVNETDMQMFRNKGIHLTELDHQIKQTFSNATHTLEIQNVNPIYIIDLKKHLDKLENQS